MTATKRNLVLSALAEKSIMRSRELAALGVSSAYIKEMADDGHLSQVRRGLYSLPGFQSSCNPSLIEVAAHAPNSVVCLLSALLFHDLTRALPNQTWVAIPTGARAPLVSGLDLRVVRMSPKTFDIGAETHILDGVSVRVYSPVRTVADCFKYLSYVGPEFAIDALREGLEERRFTPGEICEYAAINRVLNVMLPYVEALSSGRHI